MGKKITVREWINNFNDGHYDSGDIHNQCDAGWYDWFCKDSSLKNKTAKMGKIIRGITNGTILDEMYVFFKNNCPADDNGLYDQFKFCDINGPQEVQYAISIDCGWYRSKYVVFGEGQWNEPIFECGDARELRDWFNRRPIVIPEVE